MINLISNTWYNVCGTENVPKYMFKYISKAKISKINICQNGIFYLEKCDPKDKIERSLQNIFRTLFFRIWLIINFVTLHLGIIIFCFRRHLQNAFMLSKRFLYILFFIIYLFHWRTTLSRGEMEKRHFYNRLHDNNLIYTTLK